MPHALDNIVSEVVNEQPPVSPFVERMAEDISTDTVDASEGETEAAESAPQGMPNATGQTNTVEIPGTHSVFGTQENPTVFNPDIHVTDPNGLPVRNKDGSYKKKPGRKRGNQNPPSNSVKTTATVVDADNLRLQKAVAAANAVVGSLFVLGQVVGGDEFRPIVDPNTGQNEPAMLTQAWTEYFLTCENVAIPPWIGVCIATGAYFIPRFTMPVTRSRLGQFWDWVSSFWRSDEKAAETE